uniref:Uncharacterized protein n=1 Tax=Arundo donax TaxID=35708 RepID=A0A0A9DB67_ARUDO
MSRVLMERQHCCTLLFKRLFDLKVSVKQSWPRKVEEVHLLLVPMTIPMNLVKKVVITTPTSALRLFQDLVVRWTMSRE